MGQTISGKSVSLGDLLDDHYCQFHIPSYQRPYAWTTEEAGRLFDDLWDAFLDFREGEEYFLGTVVLAKSANRDGGFDVIDGQQRLVTLSILFSALAVDLKGVPDYSGFYESCRERLGSGGDPAKGIKKSVRLKVRESDRLFFKKYVQDIKIDELPKVEKGSGHPQSAKTDSQRRIAENALYLLKRIREEFGDDKEKQTNFITFITSRALLMTVTTEDQKSAMRIFSVMNNRGLDLQNSDIFKAELLEKIDDEKTRKEYAERWEDLEELVGRKNVDQVLSHINTVLHPFSKNKTVLDLLNEKALADNTPQYMIDEIVTPYFDAYDVLKKCSYQAKDHAEDVNKLLKYLNLNLNEDWIPPATVGYVRYKDSPEELRRFLKKLERLASYLNATGKTLGYRLKRYQDFLLKALKERNNPVDAEAFWAPLELSAEEIDEFRDALDGEIYKMSKDRRKALLLRVDSALSDGGATYKVDKATVEHVLPQNPSEGSEWLQWWPDEELRKYWVHRLGNLALLSRSKNSSANNYDFKTKKEKYFASSGGATAYLLTVKVLQETTWTPEIVKKRQQELLANLSKVWELDLPDNPEPPESLPGEDSRQGDSQIFYAQYQAQGAAKSVRARGRRLEHNGFLVLKGSEISERELPSCKPCIKKKREELKKSGVIDEKGVFTRDCAFPSPSGAGKIIMGGSCNGNWLWRTANGVLLGDLPPY